MLRFLIALSCSITLLAAFVGYQPPRASPGPATTLHVSFGTGGTTPSTSLQVKDASIPLIGADDFGRSAQDSWPAALKGGDYTLLGPSVDFAAGAGWARSAPHLARGALRPCSGRPFDGNNTYTLHLSVAPADGTTASPLPVETP